MKLEISQKGAQWYAGKIRGALIGCDGAKWCPIKIVLNIIRIEILASQQLYNLQICIIYHWKGNFASILLILML